jgi:outer membrane protein assembly factor BamB
MVSTSGIKGGKNMNKKIRKESILERVNPTRKVLLLLAILTLVQPVFAGDWPMLMHDIAHTSTSEDVVKPPLDLIWKFHTGEGIFSSPAISGSMAYVGSYDSYVYAIDIANGKEKWKFKTGLAIGSSPAVSGGTVYVGSNDDYVYAIDAANGKEKWKFKTGDSVSSSPAVSGGTVYVGSDDHYVYAIDAAKGIQIWKFQTGGFVGSPAVSGGMVYVTSYDGNVYAIDAAKGIQIWKFKTEYPLSAPSPAVSGGTVYVGSNDGNVYAIDAAKGKEKWRYKIGYPTSSPAVSGDMIYVGSNDHNVYALTINGDFKWKFQTGWEVYSSPAVSGDTVYVGASEHNLYALDAKNGLSKWQYTTEGSVSPPAVSNGMVYVSTFADKNGNVYAFGNKQIKIPVRWCAVQGSPAATNLNVLLQRLQRATDNIWNPGASIAFRSGIQPAFPSLNFPVIPDPNPPTSGGPGKLGDISIESKEGKELNDAISSCEIEWDKLAKQSKTPLVGPVGINLRQFVDNNGNPSDTNGIASPAIRGPGLPNDLGPVCKDPTKIQSNSGDTMYAAVNDNSLVVNDPHDTLVAHELGHVLFLFHGNGLDDDNNGVYDEICDPKENTNALPHSLMTPRVISDVITHLQKNTARTLAKVTAGAKIDPVGILLDGDTISDHRADSVHDVIDGSVDIVTVGMTENTISQTTLFEQRLFGIIPFKVDNSYIIFIDLDNDVSTGGSPSTLGFQTSFQGAELVTKVNVGVSGDGEFRAITPTVWKFQNGEFMKVTDQRISASVFKSIEQETQKHLFDSVSINMPNDVRGSRGTNVRFQAIAQQNAEKQLDRLPDAPSEDDVSEELFMTSPQFPASSVTPEQIPQGGKGIIEAIDLQPNKKAEVILGDQIITTGTTDDKGNARISFVVPTDARKGKRSMTVKVENTALTADTSVDIIASIGSISGTKFDDLNGNGKRDAEESGIEGWTLSLTNEDGNVMTTDTKEDGSYTFANLPDGKYTIKEAFKPGWIETMPGISDTGTITYTVEIKDGNKDANKDFGNFKLGEVRGMKWEDLNANNKRDSFETGLTGWEINIKGTDTITGEEVNITKTTDINGEYNFTGLTAGTYVISEKLINGWIQTTPATGTYTVTITSGANITGQDFGNFHKGKITGGGWIPVSGAKNGKATFGIEGQYHDNSNTANGNVEYQDHTTKLNIKSAKINTVATSLDKKKGVITGIVTVKTGSYPFEVYVEDNGEPGKSDVFKITVASPTPYSKGSVLGGGNIQIHE